MTDGASVTAMPALALIGPAGMLQRSTEEFSRRCNGASQLIEQDPQIDRVLSGQLDRASVTLGDVELEVEAIRDTDGVRHALLTASDGAAEAASPLQSLRFDDSPALVWLKDLDGRYLQANRRYAEVLDTSEERLIGRTDRELPAAEVVDGPRLLASGPPATEPLQLEYTIAPFERRPALAVLRFAVRDPDGEPVAVCGVAAPMSEAHLARSESARLMGLEQLGRLDPAEIRQQLIEQWGLIAGAAPDEPAAPVPERPDTPEQPAEADSSPGDLDGAIAERDASVAERDVLIAQTADLRRELGEGGRRIAALHEASATAARRAHELMSALSQEQERSAGLERSLEQARLESAEPRVDDEIREHRARAESAEAALIEAHEEAAQAQEDLRKERELAQAARPAVTALQEAQAETKQAHFELQQAHAGMQRARSEVARAQQDAAVKAAAFASERQESAELREQLARARSQPPLRWTAGGQRALSAALSGATEWRTGLKDAIKVLGTEGGWDAVTAWAPAERASLRCVAMWTRDSDRRGPFETLTWQRPVPLAATELGRASGSPHPIGVDDLESTEDQRLKLAASQGMRCAILVPIRDGVSTLGLLEFLSHEPDLPGPELSISLEAVAFQLGHFAHLLRLGARPHWRLGRF